MDPVFIAKTVIPICYQICSQAKAVPHNQRQCERLAERVALVCKTVEALIPKLPVSSGGMIEQLEGSEAIALAPITSTNTLSGFSPRQSTRTQAYTENLLSLKDTLEESLSLIKSFSGEYWAYQYIYAGGDAKRFDSIYHRLDRDIQQLTLGLSVYQIINQEEDAKDKKADLQALLGKQDQVLSLAIEAKKKTQALELNEQDRHAVLLQQMESMKLLFLERVEAVKKKKSVISERLLVPFCDLSIDSFLAGGSFGKVYIGRWREQEVAIKMVEGELTESEQNLFIREVGLMEQLRSDYVVPLYAVCNEPGRACLVMKYMQQGSLRILLDKKGPLLTDGEKHQIILDMALGLYYLHSQNILHRDFKSENVLLDKMGGARISDFGLSKLMSSSVASLGERTPDLQWFAPEVFLSPNNNEVFTQASDVYSFGVVMWEVLTGKRPYANLSIQQVASRLSKWNHEKIPDSAAKIYQDLLQACWSKDRHSRPSMLSVIRQLRTYGTSLKKEKKEEEVSAIGFPGTAGTQPGFWKSTGQKQIDSETEAEVYYRAAESFEKDKYLEKAVANYQHAATMGYTRAKTALAMHYMQGTGGLVVDKGKANALLKESASAGHARGMRILAYQYEKGGGIAQDIPKAKYWYEKAAEAGDDYAVQKLQQLRGPDKKQLRA
jgi:tRNA A-37 threonylcarbamoyl transferase component Bud32